MQHAPRHAYVLEAENGPLRQALHAWFAAAETPQKIWIGQTASSEQPDVKMPSAAQVLGQNLQLVVFDLASTLCADRLGRVLGALRSGGVLVLILPRVHHSHWLERLWRIIARYQTLGHWAAWHPSTAYPAPTQHSEIFALTADQRMALARLQTATPGARQPPLWLHADRGRGKSTVMGIAAAAWVQAGARVIVTAPSRQSAQAVFDAASSQRNHPDAQAVARNLVFVAPDTWKDSGSSVVEANGQPTVVLVDEAAAIPLPMLLRVVTQNPHVVLASTQHGYEGSGRGFGLRFEGLLAQQGIALRRCVLEQPVRYASGCWLEAFAYEALMLNAGLPQIHRLQALQREDLVFRRPTASALLADETTLQQIFALLVLAHYRTKPSDLQRLLDDPRQSLTVLCHAGHVLACCWTTQEGPLDPRLSQAIFEGYRKPKGDLIPQSLVGQLGIQSAASLRCVRIQRLVVHPSVQGQGLGSLLLQTVEQDQQAADLLGVSFALTERLADFWQRRGWHAVRLGAHADHVTASRAVMLLKPVRSAGQHCLMQAQQMWHAQLPMMLTTEYRTLDSALVLPLLKAVPGAGLQLSPALEASVLAFALAQRHLSHCFYAISQRLWSVIGSPVFARLPGNEQQVLVEVFLQAQPLATVATRHGYSGRKALERALRAMIARISVVTDLDATSSVNLDLHRD